MTAKSKVYVGLIVLGVAAVLLVGGALYVESIGVRSPESGDTISELIRQAWANEPWVFFGASHMLAVPVWFLAGHWFAAPRATYDAARLKGMTREELEAAKLRAEVELRTRNLAR